MQKTYTAGDVELTQFDLVSLSGKSRQSIISQVITFDIYESLTLPVMYCEIMINDAINLIEGFPIIGEEYIEIEFKNPELNATQNFRFKTCAITNKFTEGQGKRLYYVIQAASEEVLENSYRYIQRKYNDGNPYTMISDILNRDLKTKKQLRTDDSTARGTDKITITQLAPLQAIDMIRKRCVSKKYKSSSYVFFENRLGFNFTTLEHLISTGKNSIGDKIFFYDSNVNDDIKNINVRNILAYQQVNFSAIGDMVQSGGLANRTISIDLKTGILNTIDFNFAEQINKFAQTDPDNVSKIRTSTFMNKYANPSGSSTVMSNLLPKSSINGESFREESAGFLQSYINQLTQNIVRILIYGDSAITVGNVIKLKFPEIKGTTDKMEDSKFSSGNYLVAKVRHSFVVRDKVSYKMSIECMKPSYGESDI
jgi:hypothetical protein